MALVLGIVIWPVLLGDRLDGVAQPSRFAVFRIFVLLGRRNNRVFETTVCTLVFGNVEYQEMVWMA